MTLRKFKRYLTYTLIQDKSWGIELPDFKVAEDDTRYIITSGDLVVSVRKVDFEMYEPHLDLKDLQHGIIDRAAEKLVLGWKTLVYKHIHKIVPKDLVKLTKGE